MPHLAEINIAKLRYDLDDPRVAPFIKALDVVNGIAERSDGFVWRYKDDSGAAIDTPVGDDPRVIVNLSVWQGVRPLEHFVWNTVHRRFYQRRAEWFEILASMHFAMWWIEPGHQPTVEEATERLEHLNVHGDTDIAFGWNYLTEAELWKTARCEPIAAE